MIFSKVTGKDILETQERMKIYVSENLIGLRCNLENYMNKYFWLNYGRDKVFWYIFESNPGLDKKSLKEVWICFIKNCSNSCLNVLQKESTLLFSIRTHSPEICPFYENKQYRLPLLDEFQF